MNGYLNALRLSVFNILRFNLIFYLIFFIGKFVTINLFEEKFALLITSEKLK